jgi:DNA-binding response OmpR family regulator
VPLAHFVSAPATIGILRGRLPLSASQAEPETAGEMIQPSGNERILVVEDESVIRELAVRILTRAGYRVTETGHGLEAWNIFQADPDSFDLLLIDIRIPGISGAELARRVRNLRSSTPILLTSGLNFEYLDSEWFHSLGLDFLAKPFNPNTLLARIRMILDGHKKASAEG